MSAQHAARQLSGQITVVQQPEDIFYKDEGGKSRCMVAALRLVKLKDKGKVCRSLERDLPQGLPLKVGLYYESGIRVEEHDQKILRLMDSNQPGTGSGRSGAGGTMCPKKKTGAVRFRIEKVSRRKDGQRFKLLIEVDNAALPPHIDATGVVGCFTDAVCVRSKRKNPSGSGAARGAKRQRVRGAAATAVSSRDLEGLQAHLGGKLDALAEKLDSLLPLVDIVEVQSQRIASLERALAASFAARHEHSGDRRGAGGGSGDRGSDGDGDGSGKMPLNLDGPPQLNMAEAPRLSPAAPSAKHKQTPRQRLPPPPTMHQQQQQQHKQRAGTVQQQQQQQQAPLLKRLVSADMRLLHAAGEQQWNFGGPSSCGSPLRLSIGQPSFDSFDSSNTPLQENAVLLPR